MTLLFWAILIITISACQDKRLSYQINEAPEVDSGFYVKALEALDRAIDREPNNADAYFKKALYENKLGNINTAFSNINRALIFDKNNPDYLFLEAQIYQQQDEDSLALHKALLVENLGAGNPQLWRLISDLYYQQQQYIKALQYNSKAISLNPKGPYHYQQGLCLLAMKDTTSAKKSFLTALDQDKFRYETLKVLSFLEVETQGYEEAFRYLAQNLKANPDNRQLQYDLGTLLALTAQPDSAQLILWRLLSTDTTDFDVMHQLSLAHLQKRRYDSALYYTQKALTFNDTNLDIMLTQARVYDRRRYYTSALRQYEEIISIDSTFLPAQEELTRLRGKVIYLQRAAQRESVRPINTIQPTN